MKDRFCRKVLQPDKPYYEAVYTYAFSLEGLGDVSATPQITVISELGVMH